MNPNSKRRHDRAIIFSSSVWKMNFDPEKSDQVYENGQAKVDNSSEKDPFHLVKVFSEPSKKVVKMARLEDSLVEQPVPDDISLKSISSLSSLVMDYVPVQSNAEVGQPMLQVRA